MNLHAALQSAGSCVQTDRIIRILMADDDHNDHLLVKMAAEEAEINADFAFVDDGAKLMIHLAGVALVDDLPQLIIMDLRMPGFDGHRTLDELQAHPVLWQIPVVIFTSSTRRTDEVASFARGARWVDTKPSNFGGLIDFVLSLPERAASQPYLPAAAQDLADAQLGLLSADIFAEIEDDLLREFRR